MLLLDAVKKIQGFPDSISPMLHMCTCSLPLHLLSSSAYLTTSGNFRPHGSQFHFVWSNDNIKFPGQSERPSIHLHHKQGLVTPFSYKIQLQHLLTVCDKPGLPEYIPSNSGKVMQDSVSKAVTYMHRCHQPCLRPVQPCPVNAVAWDS